MNYLYVFLGGGLGAALRYGLNIGVPRVLGTAFPWATLIINIVGCFAMGLIAAWFILRPNLASEWRLFLATGILGGFTTFSAFRSTLHNYLNVATQAKLLPMQLHQW